MSNQFDPQPRRTNSAGSSWPPPVDLPFRCATVVGEHAGIFITGADTTTSRASRTHLVLHSPRMSQHGPDDLHAVTLCARPSSTPADGQHPTDVDCLQCLSAAHTYLHWPAFTSGGAA